MSSHIEPEVYTAFDLVIQPNNDIKSLPRIALLGSTKEKYLSVYKEEWEVEITQTKWNQVADFPVVDTEVTAICICD